MKRGQGGSSARVTGRWRKARRVPSDAAERGRGATFDNALFEIRRKPSEAGALSTAGAALVLRAVLRHGRASKRVLFVSGLFSLASRSGDKPARKDVLFLF